MIAAERNVNQVPHGTPTPDADDFFTPEFEPEPELVLEFETPLPVPELELLPETVSWPEVSEKKRGLVEPITESGWKVGGVA